MCDPYLGVAAQSMIWDTEHQIGMSQYVCSASSHIIAKIKRVCLEFSLTGCIHAAYFEADL